jgi:hypothetical protein
LVENLVDLEAELGKKRRYISASVLLSDIHLTAFEP